MSPHPKSDSSTAASAARGERLIFWLRASSWIIALAFVFYLLLSPRFYVGHFGDDARDILAARSLLQGSYRNLQAPGHPRLNFPLPGFPLLLTPFVAHSVPPFDGLKVLPIVMVVASLVLLRRLWEEDLTPVAMSALVAIVAFNPSTLALSGTVIADSAYLFFVLLSLVLLRGREGLLRNFLLGTAAGAAALLRPEGTLLLVSLGLAVIWTRAWRPLLHLAGAACGLLGVFLWNEFRTGSPSGYLSLVRQTVPVLASGLGSLVSHGAAVLKTFVLEILFGLSIEFQTDLHAFIGVSVMGSVLTVLVIGGARWLQAKRTPPALGLAVGVYVFLHLWIHGLWLANGAHYLWPLLPFAGFFAVYAIDHLHFRKIRFGASILLALLVAGLYGRQAAYAVRQVAHRPVENRLPEDTYAWIRRETPPDAMILSPQASSLSLYTHRYSLVFLGGRNPDDFRHRLLEQNVSYVQTAPVHFLYLQTSPEQDPSDGWKRYERWLAADPEAYDRTYQDDMERTQIYHVKPAPKFQRAYALYRQMVEEMRSGKSPDWTAQFSRLEAIMHLDPFPSAVNAFGAAALLSGEHLAEAQQRLEVLLKRAPSFTLAWINLARIHKRLGHEALAQQALAQAQKTVEGDEKLFMRAILQERQGP